MIKTEFLDISRIVKDKSIFKLFDAVESHGGALRFVGGAVRDVLAGLEGFELDLATDLSPDELVEACQDCGLKTVPVGLKYATTGVVINNNILKVSSLQKGKSSSKSADSPEFTDDWSFDASKRDLTINAVYADQHGNVFDYYNGTSDLENGIIRFIGNPLERIQEQPVRIMRFFRFYSIFGKGMPDLKSLKACVENKNLLRSVSVEQIRDELFKIFITRNAIETLKIMFENSILDFILPDSDKLKALKNLSCLIESYNLKPDALRRLFLLYVPDVTLAENLAMRLHLTKLQKKRLLQWARFDFDLSKATSKTYLRQAVYRFGAEFCKDKALINLALSNISDFELINLYEQLDKIVVPTLPISGADLVKNNLCEPAQTRQTLEMLQEKWIDSDFMLSKEELLAMVS